MPDPNAIKTKLREANELAYACKAALKAAGVALPTEAIRLCQITDRLIDGGRL